MALAQGPRIQADSTFITAPVAASAMAPLDNCWSASHWKEQHGRTPYLSVFTQHFQNLSIYLLADTLAAFHSGSSASSHGAWKSQK